MTIERINEIANYLGADVEKAKAMMALSAEDAAAKLTAEGFTVTADELVALGEELKKQGTKEGELDENDLENVAGGVGPCFWILVGVAVGYGGYWFARNH